MVVPSVVLMLVLVMCGDVSAEAKRSVWDIILGIVDWTPGKAQLEDNEVNTGGRQLRRTEDNELGTRGRQLGRKQAEIQQITSTTTIRSTSTSRPRRRMVSLAAFHECPSPGIHPVKGDCQRFLDCREIDPRSKKPRGKLYRCPKGINWLKFYL